jgi:hypothetical protein
MSNGFPWTYGIRACPHGSIDMACIFMQDARNFMQ